MALPRLHEYNQTVPGTPPPPQRYTISKVTTAPTQNPCHEYTTKHLRMYNASTCWSLSSAVAYITNSYIIVYLLARECIHPSTVICWYVVVLFLSKHDWLLTITCGGLYLLWCARLVVIVCVMHVATQCSLHKGLVWYYINCKSNGIIVSFWGILSNCCI